MSSTLGLSVDVEVHGRRTRKRSVATSALNSFNDGWHVDGITTGVVSPTRVKHASSLVETYLRGTLEFRAVIHR